MLRSAEILKILQRIDTQVDHSIEAFGFGQRENSEAVDWRNDVQGMKWERKDNWAEGNKRFRERERFL